MAHRKYVKHIKRIRHSATVLCLLAVTFMFAPQAVAQAVAQEKPKAKHASISTILRAVVGIHSKIPKDAISAQTLGTEREGSGVVIDSTGLILTVGYLVLEASEIVVTRPGGRKISAKLIGYDSVSGLSLIKATKPLKVKPVSIGSSQSLKPGSRVMIVSHAGMPPVSASQVVSRRPFSGYWEYLVENAIFTSPPHNNYVGAVLFGDNGQVQGIGSMSVNDAIAPHIRLPGNMFVPVNAFKNVMLDLMDKGRPSGPERPWMGVHINEIDSKVKIVRVTKDGPADLAGIKPGDVIIGIKGKPVKSMEALYRRAWALGQADAIIPLDIVRQGKSRIRVRRINIHSQSRYDTLKIKFRKKR